MAQGIAPEHARLGGLTRRPRPWGGGRPTVRFLIAVALTVAYVAFSVWVSAPWRSDLREAIGPLMAWVIPTLLAYIPGLIIGFLAFTLLTLRYRVPSPEPPAGTWPVGQWPSVTVVIAARNEERGIGPTLDRIARLAYAGPIEVVLADNDSTDRTAEVAQHGTATRPGLPAGVRTCARQAPGAQHRPGKCDDTVGGHRGRGHPASPAGAHVSGRSRSSRPQDQHVCACAGALVVENAQTNLLTRMQGWDYRLGINGVKRMQAAYNSALVAQGAFRPTGPMTSRSRRVARCDRGGHRADLDADGVARNRAIRTLRPSFTTAPEKLKQFMRQRSRWARGMFESLRRNPPRRQPAYWPSSSPGSTTSCRCSTSATSSSGSPA